MLVEPPIATFGPNKVVVGIVCALAAFYVLLFGSQLIDHGPEPFIVTFAAIVLGLVGYWLVWLLSIRVSFHQNGMFYRSLTSKRAVLWTDIDFFYYRALRRSINLIPVGTWYSFQFVAKDRKSFAFGNRVGQPDEVGRHLIVATRAALLQPAAERFDRGAELNFGPIRLDREKGLRIKKTFKTVSVPLTSVVDYRIAGGDFLVWSTDSERPTRIEILKVPNVFVLIAILDAIFPREKSQSA